MTRTTVRPFLMFEGRAREAMAFYVSVLPDAEILDTVLYGPEQGEHEGWVMFARFRVAGQEVICNDSTVKHAFTFTPALSLFVEVDDPAEVDRLVGLLGEGGEALMPVDHYGFSRRFGWVNDRFGVSWQVNCP
ncbi:VOC family protein [Caulobacter mirabilis]|uniref:PhnB-like domain-containing protein n=1 Tax=Caulobacter mirabilis TaxID=69666 RepID=A0A2D2AYC8_9CAUL|nr:VOC family protein [Caulobacter mirabilis]ATQ43016.1 hypothetical protein CSW64_11650 [Caulobacter mirabilis]